MRRWLAVACLGVAVASLNGETAHAYLRQTFFDGSRIVHLRWNQMPVRYFVTSTEVPGVTATQFQTVMARSFERWQNVPTSAITFQFGGVTTASPLAEDFQNTLGFFAAPELEGVLGVTMSLFDVETGEIVESDIFFNSAEPWAVSEAGTPDRFDLEETAVHEIGHLLGLDHSALGYFETRENEVRLAGAESVMFPFALDAGNIALRELRPDDIAGVSEIYPDGNVQATTGSLQGRVIKEGNGVFGAHVMAFNPVTGKMVAGFALNNAGQFTISGLEPGRYIVRVEPIDDDDVGSYFQMSFVDVDFRTLFFDRFVGVPTGGSSPSIDVEVQQR